jgi:hypothetical protein
VASGLALRINAVETARLLLRDDPEELKSDFARYASYVETASA